MVFVLCLFVVFFVSVCVVFFMGGCFDLVGGGMNDGSGDSSGIIMVFNDGLVICVLG